MDFARAIMKLVDAESGSGAKLVRDTKGVGTGGSDSDRLLPKGVN